MQPPIQPLGTLLLVHPQEHQPEIQPSGSTISQLPKSSLGTSLQLYHTPSFVAILATCKFTIHVVVR